MTKREGKSERLNWKPLLDDEDYLRPMIEAAVQATLEAEMSAVLGAEKNERRAQAVGSQRLLPSRADHPGRHARAQQQQIIAALNVATDREFANLFGIERRLELEIETLKGLLVQKACHRDPHLTVLVSFSVRVDSAGEQLIEKVGVVSFLFRLFQAGGKLLFDLVEAQPLAVFAQAVEVWGVHRASPSSPWLTIS
jgi:hypothetical protein